MLATVLNILPECPAGRSSDVGHTSPRHLIIKDDRRLRESHFLSITDFTRKNIEIILGRKAKCPLHRKTPKEYQKNHVVWQRTHP
jgi:hypothetical protein